jgi:hypothetical protein
MAMPPTNHEATVGQRPVRRASIFLFEEEPGEGGGEEGDEDIAEEEEPVGVPAHDAVEHAAGFSEVESEDGEDGTCLDDDGEGFGGFRVFEAEEPLGEEDVSCGADGEVFRETFDDADNDRLPPVHARRRQSRDSGAWQPRWREKVRVWRSAGSGPEEEGGLAESG